MSNVFGMVTTAASSQYTRAALESFFEHTPFLPGDQFLLIDNDQTWNPAGLAPAARDRVEIIANPHPLSFAQNGNQVIRRAAAQSADAYFLNNDIIFTPRWLDPVAADVAAVVTPTCNQNYQYKTARLELKPVMTMDEFRAGEADLPAVLAEHRRRNTGRIRAYKTNFFCVRFPPAVYRTVGLFDTRFGVAGGEDDDYCIRAYLLGFSVQVAIASYLIHFAGRSTWSGPESRAQWAAREKHFIEIFQAKWGRTISSFLLRRDASVLARDPALQAAERAGGIPALFREMLKRDNVDEQTALPMPPELTVRS